MKTAPAVAAAASIFAAKENKQCVVLLDSGPAQSGTDEAVLYATPGRLHLNTSAIQLKGKQLSVCPLKQ